MGFDSRRYWSGRYAEGGHSGAGSRGRLARFKADVVNAFVRLNGVTDVGEFGCGDGQQLALLDVPHYTGYDICPALLGRLGSAFPDTRRYCFACLDGHQAVGRHEICLSLDVVFHLVEDAVYDRYLEQLFSAAERFVLLYSSNIEASTPDAHVRHRAVVIQALQRFPGWRVAAMLPNPYPFDRGRPDETSFSDFFLFTRQSGQGAARIEIPEVTQS
jgi:hypothetical protein